MSSDTDAETANRHRVASLSTVQDHPQVIEVDGDAYLVYATDSGVFAYRNVCPHQGGPIAEGRVDTEAGTVVCPWHGWAFELDGGENCFRTDVGARLPQVETEVQNGDVYLSL